MGDAVSKKSSSSSSSSSVTKEVQYMTRDERRERRLELCRISARNRRRQKKELIDGLKEQVSSMTQKIKEYEEDVVPNLQKENSRLESELQRAKEELSRRENNNNDGHHFQQQQQPQPQPQPAGIYSDASAVGAVGNSDINEQPVGIYSNT